MPNGRPPALDPESDRAREIIPFFALLNDAELAARFGWKSERTSAKYRRILAPDTIRQKKNGGDIALNPRHAA